MPAHNITPPPSNCRFEKVAREMRLSPQNHAVFEAECFFSVNRVRDQLRGSTKLIRFSHWKRPLTQTPLIRAHTAPGRQYAQVLLV